MPDDDDTEDDAWYKMKLCFAIDYVCSMRQWVLKRVLAKYATTVINSKWKYEKLAVVVRVP